jgi:hypothetical protein
VLKELQQVVAGDPLHPLCLLKVAPELPFQDTIETANLLLFPQLELT